MTDEAYAVRMARQSVEAMEAQKRANAERRDGDFLLGFIDSLQQVAFAAGQAGDRSRIQRPAQLAENLQRAGFRRSELPEPSAEQVTNAVHTALAQQGHRYGLNRADDSDLGGIILSTIGEGS